MVYLIILLIVTVLTVIISLQNAVSVVVGILWWNFESPLAIVLLLSFATGLIAGAMILIPLAIKKKNTIFGLQKRISELEARNCNSEVSSAKTTG